MSVNGRNLWFAGFVTAALSLLPGLTVAVSAQQSGTLLSQTLTLKKGAANPTMGVQVAGGVAGKSPGTTTRIILELSTEGNGTIPPPAPALPGTARFRLTGPGGTVEFPPAGGSDATTFAGEVVVLSPGLENPPSQPGLFVLAIAHVNGVAALATETWTVELTGVPNDLRVVASIDQGTFTTLTPVGACSGGSTPCPLCPFCPPRIRWEVIYVPVDFCPFCPLPGPVCLTCPFEWNQPYDQVAFERTLAQFLPYDAQDNRLGPGRADEIQVNIVGGDPIGGVYDSGSGEYMQMIQHPRGQPPRFSVTAAGAMSPVVVVAPARTGGLYRILTWVFGALLALSVAANVKGMRARSANVAAG